jgi:hypothetical protein
MLLAIRGPAEVANGAEGRQDGAAKTGGFGVQ